jgi:NADPH:quinone reductase-like Zn-dependent oxidoreductase
MHAAFHETEGGLEVLQYGEVPDPEPGPNDVLIRVHASSMDRLDVYTREGSHGQGVRGPRNIGGRDVAGVVEAVGSAVEGIEVGQAVVGSGAATHAELALASSVLTLPMPEGVSFDEAGATPTAGRSAHQALIAKARIEPGETVLVIAAGSGVGSFALQIAKAAGCRVIATAGSAEKCERALELGADAAIDHYEEDIAERVRELTGGRGVQVVADHVGTPVWRAATDSLAPEGRFVTCGVTASHLAQIHLGRLFTQGHAYMGVGRPSPHQIRRTLLGLLSMIEQGSVKPIVHAAFPLREIAEAHRLMESSTFFGKIVLNP